MKKMKKLIALLLAASMCVAMLAGCNGNKKPEETGKPDSGQPDTTVTTQPNTATPDVPGEIFDAGNVQALVPEGWKAFPQKDVFSDEEDATDPDVICIC